MAHTGDILGRYALVRRIAGGGMGEVFLGEARERVPGVPSLVAIKVIYPEFAQKPSFIQMMLDEAKITRLLSHPNIVSTFEFQEHDGTYFMVMEHVAGTNVQQLLDHAAETSSLLSISLSLHIASEVLRALQHAHERKDEQGNSLKIVHRDVTPANVLVSVAGEVKLVDFGIARAQGRLTRTMTGNVKGKLGFFAPEMLRQEPFDARADVFALGVTLYSMLAGRHPTEGDNVIDGIARFENKRIPPPSTFNPRIPPEVDAVVMRALEPRPDVRWVSAAAFREALDALFFPGRELRRGRLAGALAALVLEVAPELRLLPKSESSPPFSEEATEGARLRPPELADLDLGSVDEDATQAARTTGLVAPSNASVPLDALETGDIARPPDPSESSITLHERNSAAPRSPSEPPPAAPSPANSVAPSSSVAPASSVAPSAPSSLLPTTHEARALDLSSVALRVRRPFARFGAWLGASLGLVLLISTAGVALRLRSARLTVATIPPGASVAVGGVAYARPTPLSIEVAPGRTHTLALSLEGHQIVRVALGPFSAGQHEPITVPLVRLVPTVHIDPVAARVMVNGRDYGTSTEVTLDVPEADEPVELRVEAAGFKPHARSWARGTKVPEVVLVHLEELPAPGPAKP